MRWSLLSEPEATPGWYNMAADASLLEMSARGAEGFLRLYRWNPHCLSFGRHEPALRRYDRDRIESLAIDVVRRPTGGRAVWHARELTYAVTAPENVFGSLAQAYRSIHETLCRALGSLGIATTLAPAPASPSRLDAGACFTQPAGGEIMVSGRKVVGSAQIRRRGALLQHGSILLDDDQDLVAGVTLGNPAPGAESPLNELHEGRLSAEEITEAIANEATRWDGDWSLFEVRPEFSDLVATNERRFRSAEWTWRR